MHLLQVCTENRPDEEVCIQSNVPSAGQSRRYASSSYAADAGLARRHALHADQRPEIYPPRTISLEVNCPRARGVGEEGPARARGQIFLSTYPEVNCPGEKRGGRAIGENFYPCGHTFLGRTRSKLTWIDSRSIKFIDYASPFYQVYRLRGGKLWTGRGGSLDTPRPGTSHLPGEERETGPTGRRSG